MDSCHLPLESVGIAQFRGDFFSALHSGRIRHSREDFFAQAQDTEIFIAFSPRSPRLCARVGRGGNWVVSGRAVSRSNQIALWVIPQAYRQGFGQAQFSKNCLLTSRRSLVVSPLL